MIPRWLKTVSLFLAGMARVEFMVAPLLALDRGAERIGTADERRKQEEFAPRINARLRRGYGGQANERGWEKSAAGKRIQILNFRFAFIRG